MLTCPHCHKKGMSAFRKLFISPINHIACKNCGKPVTISRRAIIYMLPFLFLITSQRLFIRDFLLNIGFTVILLLIYSIILVKWVPLVRNINQKNGA